MVRKHDRVGRGNTQIADSERIKRWWRVEYGRQWLLDAGAVGLLWAVLWLALPSVIAQQLQEKASQAIGRALTVRSVEVAP